MFSELYLILFLKLYIVFYVLIRSLTISFLCLFVFSIKFYLIYKGHLHYLWIRNQFLLWIEIDFLKTWTILMGRRDIWSNFIETWSCYQGFYFIKKLLNFHISWKTWINFYGWFQVRFICLSTKYNLKHCIKDHLWFFPNYMAKISDNFSKLLLILNNCSLCHEWKSYYYLSSSRIGSNINITIWALIISKRKSRKLYFLWLPNTMNNMFLIH